MKNIHFRFLANEFNLAGRNNLERAQADETIDAIKDLMETIAPIMGCKDEEQKKELVAKLKERACECFDRLCKRLEARYGWIVMMNNSINNWQVFLKKTLRNKKYL